MRVAILGCGVVGSAIARLLAKERYVESGICLDIDIKKARNFLTKGINFEIKKVNAKDKKELLKHISNVDLIVNALPTSFTARGKTIFWNPRIMEVALQAGVNYIDLACEGDDKKFVAEQLAYHKKFEKEKLLAIINTGAAPGLSNLLAKYNADELENVERIRIRTLEEQRGSEFVLPWSKEGILELVWKVLVYRNGRYLFKEPFSEVDVYEFPSPFGKLFCYLVSHDEAYTIPHFIPVKHLDMKAGGSDIEMLRTFYRLGLFKKDVISIGKIRIHSKEFLRTILPDALTPTQLLRIVKKGWLKDGFFGIFVESIGRVMKKKIFIKSYIIFPSQRVINRKLPGTNYISYPTALAAVSFIKATFKKKLYGVLPPEALQSSVIKRIIEILEKRGIVVNVEYRSL